MLRSSADDQVTIVAAGVTVHEALSAADQLAARRHTARVIDLYSVKPVDAATLRQAAPRTPAASSRSRTTGPRAASATRCWESFADGHRCRCLVRLLAVRAMPGSATPDEQLHAAGIDSQAIAAAALTLARA